MNNKTISEKAQDNMYSLLTYIFDMCSKQHTKISLSNLVKYYGLPTNTLIELKSMNILKSNGNSDYFWCGSEPTCKFADDFYTKCVKIMTKYTADKKRERKEVNPNNIRVGTKSFIKIIKEDVPKEVVDKLVTPTEFRVDNYIKYMRRYLHNRNMLSFSDYCESVNISEQFENAFIQLGIVKKINGLIVVAEESYKPSDIREIITVQRNYKIQDLPKPKMIEEFTNINKKSEIMSTTQKLSKKHNKCLSTLEAIYNDYVNNNKIKSINFYKKTFGINSELALAIKSSGVITKGNSNYVWSTSDKPNMDLVEKVFAQRRETVKNRLLKNTEVDINEKFQTLNNENATNNKDITDNVCVNKNKIQPTFSETYFIKSKKKSTEDFAITKEIALKLIKLGELTEANRLLNTLV